MTRAPFPEGVHLGSPEGHQRFFNLNLNSKWGFVCFCRRCRHDGPNYQSSLVKCQKVKVHVNTVGDGDEEKSRCEIAGESQITLRVRVRVRVRVREIHSRTVLGRMIMMEIMMTMLLRVFDPVVVVCAEEDVIVTVAGEEDAMFGSDSLIVPSYKLTRNKRRYTRLLQMADSGFFK